MADRILIWGAGGHGKVVADLIRGVGLEIAGFIDANSAKLGEPFAGHSVVITESELLSDLERRSSLPFGVWALAHGIGNNRARWKVHKRLAQRYFPTLIHETATIGGEASLGAGTVAMASVVVNADAKIGEAVILNTSCVIEHDCVVEDGAHVSPGAVLCGGVRVGRLAWVGAGATVLPNIVIGELAVVGAGSIVTQHVPAGETVVGNPAHFGVKKS